MDLLVLIRRHLVLPIDDWTLGPVAGYCGFPDDPDDTLNGFIVGLLYECFQEWGNRLPVRKIRRRNANDVLRLARVAQWLREQNRLFERNAISVPSVDEWGRYFARGVIRAYIDGRGDHNWVRACVRRSGVTPSEVRRLIDELQERKPESHREELFHRLFP